MDSLDHKVSALGNSWKFSLWYITQAILNYYMDIWKECLSLESPTRTQISSKSSLLSKSLLFIELIYQYFSYSSIISFCFFSVVVVFSILNFWSSYFGQHWIFWNYSTYHLTFFILTILRIEPRFNFRIQMPLSMWNHLVIYCESTAQTIKFEKLKNQHILGESTLGCKWSNSRMLNFMKSGKSVRWNTVSTPYEQIPSSQIQPTADQKYLKKNVMLLLTFTM